MTTQYTSILKLALPVQGELSGTWGDTVNDNITSMVEEAIAGRAVINSWTANSHTLTTANGTTSESRCAMLEFTDTGAALTGNATVICPTASKIYIAKNAVGSSRTVTLKTSAGTGIAVPDGTTMFLFCDGTNVVEAVTNMNSFTVGGTVTIVAIKDEDDMVSDSATALATQQSIKAYVDSQIAATNELSEVLAAGNTSGGTAIQMTTTDEVQFRDTALKISSSADGQLDIDADTELEITAPTVDIDASTAVLVSNDLKLDSDDAVLGFGVDNDVTVTHIPDAALRINDAIAVEFRDADLSINSSADGQLDIDADTEIEITAPTVDIDASTEVNISGATKVGGTLSVDTIAELTATAGVTVDDIIIKDNTVGTPDSSGTDVAGTNVTVKGGAGTGTGAGGSLVFQTAPAGTTGSTPNAQVTAMTIDSAGDATFTGAAANMSWDKSADSLTFADNAKAVFGASGDLQIYHDGSNSYIKDLGTGDLLLSGNTGVQIQSDAGENMITTAANGAVSLFYDASAKLTTTSTGIDVTGTVTADGLTVDGDSITANAQDAVTIEFSGSEGIISADRTGGNFGELFFKTTAGAAPLSRLKIAYNGDISFYDDTGVSQSFFWDSSAESLGIGTTSPKTTLNLSANNSGQGPILTLENSDTSITTNDVLGQIDFYANDGSTGGTGQKATIQALAENSSGTSVGLSFGTSPFPNTTASEAMRIDSNGNVGIGTASPTFASGYSGLHINKDYPEIHLTNTNSGATASDGFKIQQNSASNVFLWNYENAFLAIGTNNTERMRINSSGIVMVGKTSTGLDNAGVEFDPTGQLKGTAANVVVGYFNRTSSDGSILEFRKDNTAVGTIGTSSGNPYIEKESNSGLQFGSSGQIIPRNSGAISNNTVDLGSPSYRFKDLHLSGGAYLGGTAAANKLDDYEEGTWTPTVAGDATGAFSTAEATYTKVGRLVFIQMYVVVSTNFTSNYIGGLPFTVGDFLTGTSLGQSAVVLTNAADTVTGAAVEAQGTMRFYNDHNTASLHNPNTTNGGYRLALCYQV